MFSTTIIWTFIAVYLHLTYTKIVIQRTRNFAEAAPNTNKKSTPTNIIDLNNWF